MTDWQKLVEFIHHPDVRAVVGKYVEGKTEGHDGALLCPEEQSEARGFVQAPLPHFSQVDVQQCEMASRNVPR